MSTSIAMSGLGRSITSREPRRPGFGHHGELFRVEVETLVRLETPGNVRPFPRRLTQALARNLQFLGNDRDEHSQKTVIALVTPALDR